MDGSQSHQMLPLLQGARAGARTVMSSGAPQSQVPSVSRRTAETWGLTALPCIEVPTPAQSVAFFSQVLLRSFNRPPPGSDLPRDPVFGPDRST